MQIIVLGPHRSGTSLITRLINMMGAYFGPEGIALPVEPNNPKGFWERKDAVRINGTLLRQQGCVWHALSQWDFARPPQPPPELRQQMRNLILNMDAHRPWVLKDPRLCLTLPCWRGFLEVPVAVLVYRDPLEAAASLEARNGYEFASCLALWEYYAVGALNASADMPRVFVRHDQALKEPVALVRQLYADLLACDVRGLREPSEREIRAFVEPQLYRARADASSAKATLTPFQAQLAEYLGSGSAPSGPLRVSPEGEAAMRRHERSPAAQGKTPRAKAD